MTTLHVSVDRDGDLWIARSGVEPSPAGFAVAELTSTMRLAVDALTGEPIELTVDLDPGTTEPVGTDRGALEHWQTELTSDTLEFDGPMTDALLRLALLEDAARTAAALSAPSPWWGIEAGALRRELGLPADVEDDGGHRAWGHTSAGPIEVVERRELTASAEAMLPTNRRSTRHSRSISITAARDRLRAATGDLGAIPPAGGRVLVDPGALTSGVFDLRDGCDTSLADDADVITVRALLQAVYAARLDDYAAVIFAGDTPVAMGPFALRPGNGQRPIAEARLIVHDDRDLATLELVVTDQPRLVPRATMRRRRNAARLCRLAASSYRLGDHQLVAELWGRAVGDDRPAPSIRPQEPFLGEVDSDYTPDRF